jgi:signal transduction histidine kinase
MHEPEPIAETPSVSRPRMNVIEDEPAPVREGLPPGFRMRADAHYVDQLDARMSSIPVRLIDTQALETTRHNGDAVSAAFVESVKRLGVLQPLLVLAQGTRYRVIAGRRRLAAAVAAGLRDVPCLVQHVDSEQAEQMALASNLPATRPRPSTGTAAGGAATAGVASELGHALSTLISCANLLSSDSAMTQTVAASLVRAEATRAMGMLVALRVLRDEMPLSRGQVLITSLFDLLARTATAERQVRGIRVEFTPDSVAPPATITCDAALLVDALSALIFAAASLSETSESASASIRGSHKGDRAIAVDASTGTRGQTTFHVSQTIVEVPAVWLGRAFDIAWPIRDGVSALIRLQAARKIAQAHGGDLEVSAIDRGTAFLLTIPTTT